MILRFSVFFCLCFSFDVYCLAAEPLLAQPNRIEEAKVSGRVSFPKRFKLQKIQVKESRLVLLEEFVPSPLPTPKEFDDWDRQQRSEWFAKWEKTQAGQEFQRKEERRFGKLKKHETKLAKDFGFEFDKVNPGDYDLAGELEIEFGGKSFLAEFFAKVKVSEVEELDLKEIELQLVRLLKSGEKMPTLKANGKMLVERKKLARKNTLVVFWSRSSGVSDKLATDLRRMGQHDSVQVVAIGVGEKASTAEIVVPDSDFDGLVESVESTICVDWGVRVLPSVWLVDRKGKIVATPLQLFEANYELSKILGRK